jgi:hypothetical protein
MGFFRMARPVGIAQNGIDDNGHERSRDVLTLSDTYEAVRGIARRRRQCHSGPSQRVRPEVAGPMTSSARSPESIITILSEVAPRQYLLIRGYGFRAWPSAAPE